MAKTKILTAGKNDYGRIYAIRQPEYREFWDVIIDDSTRFVVNTQGDDSDGIIDNLINLLKQIKKESN